LQATELQIQPRSPIESEHYDRTLVTAILRKDRKATAEFVALYADAVHSYVRQRLIPRADLIDDLVQEVFAADPPVSPSRFTSASLSVNQPILAPGQMWNLNEKLRFAPAQQPNAGPAIVWVLNAKAPNLDIHPTPVAST